MKGYTVEELELFAQFASAALSACANESTEGAARAAAAKLALQSDMLTTDPRYAGRATASLIGEIEALCRENEQIMASVEALCRENEQIMASVERAHAAIREAMKDPCRPPAAGGAL
jgi:hypothetical protein